MERVGIRGSDLFFFVEDREYRKYLSETEENVNFSTLFLDNIM